MVSIDKQAEFYDDYIQQLSSHAADAFFDGKDLRKMSAEEFIEYCRIQVREDLHLKRGKTGNTWTFASEDYRYRLNSVGMRIWKHKTIPNRTAEASYEHVDRVLVLDGRKVIQDTKLSTFDLSEYLPVSKSDYCQQLLVEDNERLGLYELPPQT